MLGVGVHSNFPTLLSPVDSQGVILELVKTSAIYMLMHFSKGIYPSIAHVNIITIPKTGRYACSIFMSNPPQLTTSCPPLMSDTRKKVQVRLGLFVDVLHLFF